jgi:SlyX protein
MDERALIEVETKLAFQEDALRRLNEALVDQQNRVAELERICRVLVERMARMTDEVHKGSAAEEVPPHY